ncbi:MAG: hypothetical protein B6D64_07650, partial [Bacteroidetes bacterium 4484_276]
VNAQNPEIEWIKQDGGNSDDFGTSITTDENYVYSTGVFYDTCFIGDTVLISNGSYDTYISKYDKKGNFIWVKQFGGTEYDRCTQVLHNNGHILMTGFFGDTHPGQTGFFLLDMDINGAINWIKEIEGQESYYGSALATDAWDNIYLSGCFEDTLSIGGFTLISKGEYDIFITKLDDTGNVIWVNQAGGVGEDISTSITLDKSDNIYLTGSFEDTATFMDTTITSLGYQDIFIVKYNSSGEKIWLKKAGGDWGARASSITINKSGQLFLAGVFGGTTYFGNDSLVSNGMRDIFLARYNLSGTLQWIDNWGSEEHDSSSDLVTDNDFIYFSCRFGGETTLNDTTLTGSTAQIIQLSFAGEIVDYIQLGGYYRNKCTINNSSALFVTGALGPWPDLFGDTILSPSWYGYDAFISRINYGHTGIEESVVFDQHLKIYPNPASTYINIESNEGAVVSILNINGQLIKQYSFVKGLSERSIDISSFPPGLYIVTLQTKNTILSGKMIKH